MPWTLGFRGKGKGGTASSAKRAQWSHRRGLRAGSANKAACTGLSTPSSRGALLCAGSRPAVVGLKGPRERRATVLLEVRRH